MTAALVALGVYTVAVVALMCAACSATFRADLRDWLTR